MQRKVLGAMIGATLLWCTTSVGMPTDANEPDYSSVPFVSQDGVYTVESVAEALVAHDWHIAKEIVDAHNKEYDKKPASDDGKSQVKEEEHKGILEKAIDYLREKILKKKDKKQSKSKSKSSNYLTDADIEALLEEIRIAPITAEDKKIGNISLEGVYTKAQIISFLEEAAKKETLSEKDEAKEKVISEELESKEENAKDKVEEEQPAEKQKADIESLQKADVKSAQKTGKESSIQEDTKSFDTLNKTIEQTLIKRDIYKQKENALHIERKGPFVTYKKGKNSVTVYDGVDALHAYKELGSPYFLPKGLVVQIHVESDVFKTAKEIGVGDQRGKAAMNYGAPQSIIQNLEQEELIYIYSLEGKPAKAVLVDPYNAQDKRHVLHRGIHQRGTTSTAEDSILAITMKGYSIKALDYFAGPVRDNTTWPKMTFRYYKPKELQNDDFVLEGYRIDDPFSLSEGTWRNWNLAGNLWNQRYVASNNGVVVYNEKTGVSKVFLGAKTGVTRRGIGVGTNKLLLLLLYGAPTKVYTDFNFALEPEDVVYEYKNPQALSEYLIFVINNKTKFIDAVMLSDRPTDQIPKAENKTRFHLLLYNQ